MTVAGNRLEQLCNFIPSKILADTLMVKMNAKGLVISLAKSFHSKKNAICRANWTNMRMLVVRSKGDLLPILAILLNSESNSQLLRHFCEVIK